MGIKAYRNTDTDDYTIVIGEDAWEMNSEATQPNGVCIYLGPIEGITIEAGSARPLGTMPKQILVKILHIIEAHGYVV